MYYHLFLFLIFIYFHLDCYHRREEEIYFIKKTFPSKKNRLFLFENLKIFKELNNTKSIVKKNKNKRFNENIALKIYLSETILINVKICSIKK